MALISSASKSGRLLASRRYTHETLTDAQESFTNVLDLQASETYTQAAYIPSSSLPFSGSSQINLSHRVSGSNVFKYWHRHKLTKSNTNNETWFFLNPSGSDNGIGAQLIHDDQEVNFISPKYSIAGLATSTTADSTPGYLATLYKSSAVSHSVQTGSLDGDDIVSTNDYIFDYKTGVVEFKNSSLDPTNSEYLYMTVYQYTGTTLATGIDVRGNITGSDIYSTGTLDIDGATTLNGTVTLGNATSDTITATGRFNTDIVPSTDSARDLGTSALQFAEAHIDTGYIDSLTTTTNVDIDDSGGDGAMDGVIIGAATAAAGTFTTLNTTGLTTIGDASGDSLVINAATINPANIAAGTDNTVVVYNGSTLLTDEIDSRVWGSTLVDTDGSGANNELATWSDSNTVIGEGNLTFDGSTLGVTGGITSTGNIITEGDVIAENYIVSSSVTYMTSSFSSGSTQFGDTVSDTHKFTGSLDITGSITPGEDNKFDLGSATLEWKDLYIDGTANIDSLSAGTAAIGDLTSGRVVIAGGSGELQDDSDLTFSGDTLTATKIGAFEAAGAIDFSDEAMTNVDINSGAIDGTAIGANTHTSIKGTTIDATTDFTIDGLVITANTITNDEGLSIIASSGDITLDPAGNNVLPGGDSADDLGASGTAWNKLWVDDIDLNGQGSISIGGTGRIDLDADDDTSVRASADDVITFEAGAVDIAQMTSTMALSGSSISTGSFGYLNVDGDAVIGGNLTFGDAATDSVSFSADITSHLIPNADATYNLGSSSQGWNDLFLGEGGVINWDNGDFTATQANNLLTLSGGNTRVDRLEIDSANDYLDVDTDLKIIAAADITLDPGGNNVKPGSDNADALGVSGTAWSDLFLGDGAVINFNAGDVTATHSSNLLSIAGGNTRVIRLEIDSASDYLDVDTDLKIIAAADVVVDPGGGELKVDGNVVPNSDSADSLGASGTAWLKLWVDDIDLNGQGSISIGGTGRIDLNASDDSSIRASDDDTITFEANGTDIAQMTSTMALSGSSVSTGSLGQLNLASGGNVYLPDSVRVNFGDGNDLKIYHSGAHSIIQDTGTGNLRIKASIINIQGTSTAEDIAKFTENAGAELYYDDSKKFETTNTGIAITGDMGATISGSSVSTGSFGRLQVIGNTNLTGDITVGGNLTLGDAASDSVSITADLTSHLIPNADATYDLGSSSQGWNDLHLGSGAVINFNNGDVTATHSANLLSVAGGNTRVIRLEIDGANDYLDVSTDLQIVAAADVSINAGGGNVKPSANDGSALGVSGTAWSDLFLADAGVINWNAGNTTITGGSSLFNVNVPVRATKIEIDSASDYLDVSTDLQVIAAADIVLDPAGGEVKVDGNLIPNSDSADDLGASGVAWNKLWIDDIDLNGQGSISIGGTGRIDLDADDDTSIRASADDVITFEAGAVDIAQMTSTMAISGSSISTGSFGYLNVDTIGRDGDPATAYIGGGEIDATVIGGETAATATVTTLTTNTGIVPDANDGAYLGQAGTAFSDLFLAEGGVINWDSGDATLTQASNVVTLAGATLTGTLTNALSITANGGIGMTSYNASAAVSNLALDIDGMTDIGADLATGDIFAVDDGAGGTNRKVTIDRIADFVSGSAFSKISGDVSITGAGVATVTGAETNAALTAGDGISAGGTFNGATARTFAIDLSEYSDVQIASGDKFLVLDSDDSTEQLESVDDVAAFISGSAFGKVSGDITIAGTGVSTIGADTVANSMLENMAANTVKVRNANSSGDPSDLALATTQILIGDGTGFTAAALSGDVTMTNAGVVTIGNDKIDSQHYAAASIDNEHLADNAVDSAELAAGSVDDAHLSDGVATGLAGAGMTATSGVMNVIGGTGITANANDIAITADSVGDTQLEYNTGQHLTTSSSPTFTGITATSDVAIQGNLTITGDRIEAQVGSLQVADHTITVGSGSNTSALMNQAGLDFGVSGSVAFLRYDHSTTMFSSSVDLKADQLHSTIATGTAPLTVQSTTVVSNLNADKLDGQEGSYYTDFSNMTVTAGEITHAMLADDLIDGDNIGNDVINSEHYAAASIDNEHLADNAVDSDEIASGAVDDDHLSDGVASGLAGAGMTATSGVMNVIGGTGITANANEITTTDGDIVHDNLSGFVANEHIDHSSVSITAGAGLSGGGTIASTRTIAVDISEFSDVQIASGDKFLVLDSDNSTEQLESIDDVATFMAGAGMTATSGVLNAIGSTGITVNADNITTNDGQIDHDALSNFVADEHIAHSGVTLTAGDGLNGGGTIAASRTFNVDAAQTVITSLFATDIKIGEDDQTKIDFETADTINFYTNNVHEFQMTSGGTFHADADIVAYSSTVASDEKLKTNINDTKYGLSDILKLRGVDFNWKEKFEGKRDLGFIAQEVQEIIPELVKEVDTIGTKQGEEGGGTHLTVDYAKVVPILVESIKELKSEIDELKKNQN